MDKRVSLHPDAFGDLDHDATVARVASFAATEGGKQSVKEILARPLYCVRTLKARAADIHGLLRLDRDGISRLRKELELVAKYEEGATWCAKSPEELDEDTAEAVQTPYFKGFTKPLNSIWPALWANNCYSAFAVPLLAISAPLSYLLAPYFIIRFKLKIPLDFQMFVKLMYHSFKGAGAAMSIAFGKAPSFAMQLASVVMTCVMYFQAVVSSVRHSMKLSAAIQRVASQVNCLNRVLRTCNEIVDDYDEPFYRRWCDGFRSPGPKTCSTESYDETFRPWCTSFSKALQQYSGLDRDKIRARLKQLFTLDAVCAFNAASAAHALKRVTFLPSAYDAVVIRRGRRLRDGDAANDFASMRGANGIVLTGPNASGKSTLLRMVGCVVLLGQTIGMAPADSCALTPVKYVTTMMGIRDDPAAGRSKFQNELQRAGECIESARSRPRDVGLLLLDEIFGGTDSVQGDVCGSKVLTSMTETTGCIYVLATHQRGLVEHSKTLPGIRQYKMESGYKLVPGVNDTFNASDLFGKAMS